MIELTQSKPKASRPGPEAVSVGSDLPKSMVGFDGWIQPTKNAQRRSPARSRLDPKAGLVAGDAAMGAICDGS